MSVAKTIHTACAVFLFASFFFVSKSLAQTADKGINSVQAAPANNKCSNAISLGTVTASTTTVGDLTNATGDGSSTCHSPTSNVWYTFTVPAGGGTYAITMTAITMTYPTITIYSGSCANLTQINCAYGSSTSANLTASCLAAGTYYINCDEDFGSQGTFSITVTQVSAGASAPANDVCAGAISLGTVSSSTTSTGNNFCASADLTSTCHSPTENVWYTFTVPAGGGTYSVSVTAGTMTYPCLTVYSGTCGSLTALNCTYGSFSNASVSIQCLSAGTYYVNVDDDYGSQGTFSVTVTQTTAGATAPSNDNCSGATTLTPGASCTGTVGDVLCSSQSQAGCVGTANDDVWYKFVASNTSEFINLTASANFDPVVQVFSGTCASLTSIWCNDASFPYGSGGSQSVTGLTVGSTYYIRVYDYYSGYPTTTTFTICVTDPPTCPASFGTGYVSIASLPYVSTGNSTCGKGNDVTGVNVTNVCGSSSYYGGEDMVYSFTPATTGVVTITQTNTSGSVGMMLYSGCPYTGTCVANAQNSNNSRTICLTLIAGTTYYLVIDSYSPSCYSYDISITAPTSGTPAGTDCASADPISSIPYTKTGLTTCCMGNDYNSTNACLSSYMNGEDYVFSYTPTSNILVDITLSNTLSYTGVFVVQGCPSSGTCIASNTNSSGNPYLCGVSLTAGVTYYIIVDTYPSPTCTGFDIAILQSGALTTCNLAYSSTSITYDGSDPLTGGTTISFTDDHFSSSYIPIGFNFCFDGVQYTQMLVSSNGYLIFDPINCVTNLPGSNATPNGYSAWSISGAIPNTTNAPRNAILGPWQDIDPGVTGVISYNLYGTSPNRRLVVSYSNVAMFSSTCNSTKFNGQIKLYETSNNIEIHLKNKNLCTSWNSGQAILGLHNYNGTIAVVPAGGYNAPTQWTATNQGWRFVTSCSTCSVILPIDMLEFTAQYSDRNNNFIRWITVKEEHVKFFHVERSENGTDFVRVSHHNPKAQTGATYTYNDLLPDNNRNYYYRICTEDIDGAISYSGIRVVQQSKDFGPFVIYPNPFNNDLNVAVQTSDASEVIIEIFDAVGNKVLHQERTLDAGNNEFSINGVTAAPGLLLVKISDQTGKLLYTHRLIKQ